MQNFDPQFMRHALEQAKIAAKQGEVPIGAVIVAPDGAIIAATYNKTEQAQSQTAHAELLAIAQAGKKLQNWRLTDCWIYVTLEPCAMCMHALILSRIAGVVYGADSPLFGHTLEKYHEFKVYNVPMPIKAGVLANEAAQLLKDFFEKRRESSGKEGDGS